MDKFHTKSEYQQFPWPGKFKTKYEIDSYFSGDKVLCLLCGKGFKTLSTHLNRVHALGADEYRDRYGLPWKHGLCGNAFSIKLSNAMNKRRESGFLPDIDAARKKSKQAKKRDDQPYFAKVKTENLRSANDKRKKFFDEDFQRVLVRMLQEKKSFNPTTKPNGT